MAGVEALAEVEAFIDFDLLEGMDDDLVGPGNPLLSQASDKAVCFPAAPLQYSNQSMDLVKVTDGADSTINAASADGQVDNLNPDGLSSATGLNLEVFMSSDDPAAVGQATGAVIPSNEHLTTGGAWIDGSQLLLFQNNQNNMMPVVPDYGVVYANSAIDGEFVVAPATDCAGTEATTLIAVDSATEFHLTMASITDFPSTSTYDHSAGEMNSGPSSVGKCKSSRGKKKKFLHENPDKEDPMVKRAAGAKDYRERKKQETAQREQGLLQELEELKARNSTLQQKLDANEAVSSDKTVKILESIVSAVKAVGGGDVIVMPRLADKQAVTLTDDRIQQIVQAACLSNPGKRFRLIFDIDEQGQLIAQKID